MTDSEICFNLSSARVMRLLLCAAFLPMLAACVNNQAMIECQANTQRMTEYREKTIATTKRWEFNAELDEIARQSPSFEKIYVALLQARVANARITLPKVKKHVWPTYPEEMRRDSKEAMIFFAVILGAQGQLLSIIHIAHPALVADAQFVSAAQAAIDQWEFEPATINGVSSEYAIVLPVSFQLK